MKAKLVVLTLIFTLLLPSQLFAEKTLDPVKSITFKDVEPLMRARSQAIIDNSQTFSGASTSFSRSTSSFDSYIGSAQAKYDSNAAIGAGINQDLAEAFKQLQFLLVIQKSSLVGSTNLTNTGYSLEMTNDKIVYSAEAMYISYNQLNYQLESSIAAKALLEKRLEATKLQQQLGMVSTIATLDAEKQLEETDLAIKTTKESMNSIKQQFNIWFAQNYDTDLAIGDVPQVSDSTISAINVDEDYLEAEKKSYNVRMNEDIDKKNNEKRTFKSGFYKAYQKILDKQKALSVAEKKFDLAKKNIESAEIKYKLGMLSTLQLLGEQSSFAATKASYENAQFDLFKAYREYEWAKRGVIVV
ncbi:MAG: TolC family protein [Peptococcaceae bacterium]|nr:TolC family protein [Peptococcaceae bacterium]